MNLVVIFIRPWNAETVAIDFSKTQSSYQESQQVQYHSTGLMLSSNNRYPKNVGGKTKGTLSRFEKLWSA